MNRESKIEISNSILTARYMDGSGSARYRKEKRRAIKRAEKRAWQQQAEYDLAQM